MNGTDGVNGKARLITFDLETYRTRNPAIMERVRGEAMEKRPAGNTLKELKIEWDTTAAREARAKDALDKTAVDPLLAEVLVCCMRGDGVDIVCGLDPVFSSMKDRSEQDMMADLASWLDYIAGPRTIWVGHNIEGFDLLILLNRWRRFGITPPKNFPVYIGRRWRGWTFDTMLRCPCKNGLGFVSLDDACEALGLPGKLVEWKGQPFDGSRVGEAFEAEEFDLIARYCAEDVSLERALYMAMTSGDTWGTYGIEDDLAEQLAEIDASGQSESIRAIAKLTVLERAGLVPRAA